MTPQSVESDSDYAHRVLSHIFDITLDPHRMTAAHGHRLLFLPNLNQDLNDQGQPLKLSTSVLDQAIMEACATWTAHRPLMDYLLPCWKRAVRSVNLAKNPQGSRLEVHEEAKRLSISSCLFALTMPALYG